MIREIENYFEKERMKYLYALTKRHKRNPIYNNGAKYIYAELKKVGATQGCMNLTFLKYPCHGCKTSGSVTFHHLTGGYLSNMVSNVWICLKCGHSWR